MVVFQGTLAFLGFLLVAYGAVVIAVAGRKPGWLSRPMPWADADAVDQFPPARYRLQGLATALMGTAFLVAGIGAPSSGVWLSVIVLSVVSTVVTIGSTRLGGWGYRSKAMPALIGVGVFAGIIAVIALFVVVLPHKTLN